jgi:hypothetical protein
MASDSGLTDGSCHRVVRPCVLATGAGKVQGVMVFLVPSGTTQSTENGPWISNAEYAQHLLSNIESGGKLVLPSFRDEMGNLLWDFRIEGGPPGQVDVVLE